MFGMPKDPRSNCCARESLGGEAQAAAPVSNSADEVESAVGGTS